MTDSADCVVEESADICDACGKSLAECHTEVDYITQIISLPELKPMITEVRHNVKVCRTCGKRVKAHTAIAPVCPLISYSFIRNLLKTFKLLLIG